MIYIIFTLVLTVALFFLSWRRETESRDSNTGLSLTVSGCFLVIFGFINYFGLPVMNFWGFHGVWLQITLVVILGPLFSYLEGLGWDYGWFEWDVYDSDDRPRVILRWIPAIVVGLIFFCSQFQTCSAFRAEEYQEMLEVEVVADSTFNNEVHPIPVEKMRSVDQDYAKKVADDKLGLDPGLGSRVLVGKMTIQNITGEFTINGGQKLSFNDDLIWVAPLEHAGFWKWVSHDVTPGYVIVDATDYQKVYLVTEVNGKPLKMRFLENACFNDDIERHIKSNGYASKGLADHCLEIAPDGRPYWVLASYEKTVGFSGKDSKGVITVDVQTGELNEYSIHEAPEWIDRIQPEDFVHSQICNWGDYKHGWWNSLFAQQDCESATPGMSIVYSEGRSYWYTGIKSAKADEATSGFMLVDTKNKKAKLYRIAGVNETEAMKIAEDQQQAKSASYSSTNPILYNVRGIPTYFVTLKSNSGNIMGYCFVAVNNRQAVGYGSSKTEAEKNYLNMLMRTERDKIKDGPVQNEVKQLIVREIVLVGDTYYLLFEGKEFKGVEFTGSHQFFKELKYTKKGHRVSVSYGKGNNDVIPFDTFDNLDFEL